MQWNLWLRRMASTAASSSRVVRDPSRVGMLSRRQAIHLTPSAVQRVKFLLSQSPTAKALKIGVLERGCSGLTYSLDYADRKASLDEEVLQDDVCIWIDSKAQLSLLGSEMDYVESRLASEFVFKNPNIKSVCGCGESFSV